MAWLTSRLREGSTHTALAALCIGGAMLAQLGHMQAASQSMESLTTLGEPSAAAAVLAGLGVVFAIFGVILKDKGGDR